MNYIEQLNGFRDRRRVKPLLGQQIGLYMALLEQANILRWPPQFQMAGPYLTAMAGLSETALRRGRQALVEQGYITYSSGSGGQLGYYGIVPLRPETGGARQDAGRRPAQTAGETAPATARGGQKAADVRRAAGPHTKTAAPAQALAGEKRGRTMADATQAAPETAEEKGAAGGGKTGALAGEATAKRRGCGGRSGGEAAGEAAGLFYKDKQKQKDKPKPGLCPAGEEGAGILDSREWRAYAAMRRSLGAPLNDWAREAALRQLQAMAAGGEQTQRDILRQSVERCWKNLYPLSPIAAGRSPPGGAGAGRIPPEEDIMLNTQGYVPVGR